MAESSSLVPSFTTEVEPSRLGAGDASARLDAFAAEHGVAAGPRARLAAVAVEVVSRLADPGPGSAPIVIEADIGPGDFQIVFTRETSSREAVAAVRARLAGLGEPCDGFSTEAVDGTALEVWVCFSLA